MKNVDLLLADYASYHQTQGNIRCHFVGIPLIVYGIFATLRTIPIFPPIGAAEALILLASIYYFMLDFRLAVVMLLVSLSLDALAFWVADFRIGIAAFVGGWIFQAIGHAVYEKKAPAFLKNLTHLLIGPIFLINEAFRVRPLHQSLS